MSENIGRDIVRRGWAYDEEPPELPWLGDIDRRADDDVEFCDEDDDL